MMILLQLALLSVGTASSPRSLDFSIAASQGTYLSGKPIALRCKFANVTSSTQTVLLPGRHSGAPAFLRARVWSDRGALLTKNDVSPMGGGASVSWIRPSTGKPKAIASISRQGAT